jgi:hydroxymethylglutaryl-CoA lyase
MLKHIDGTVGINGHVVFTTLHLHDTFGRAAECVKTALDLGITSFDGSVAGLGGCPYASTPGKRAPGNISTETLVRTIHSAGRTTGVDLAALERAAAFAREIVATSRARAAVDPQRGGVA